MLMCKRLYGHHAMTPDYSLNPMAMDDDFALRHAQETIAELCAEIERLKAEIATCRELRKYDSSDRERLQALIAKLRTRVELADK